MASTTIPVEGDTNYRDAFSMYARKQKKTMAELVRRALDEVYGSELQPYLSLFAASSGASKCQVEHGRNKRGRR